ncbi:unnamed protein product, partial [Heterosigma akashiwo]
AWTCGASRAPRNTPGSTINHRATGTSPSAIRCSRKGTREVQPPATIPVTIARRVSTPRTRVSERKVAMALPMPMLATNTSPAENPTAASFRRVAGSASSSSSGRPAAAAARGSILPPLRAARSTRTATPDEKRANSSLQCDSESRGWNVPITAPNQAEGTVYLKEPQTKTSGSFLSQLRNPKTPLPKVIVATVKATPNFTLAPSKIKAGTKTMPPPTGTELAKQAASMPMNGMNHNSSVLALSIFNRKRIHQTTGSVYRAFCAYVATCGPLKSIGTPGERTARLSSLGRTPSPSPFSFAIRCIAALYCAMALVPDGWLLSRTSSA